MKTWKRYLDWLEDATRCDEAASSDRHQPASPIEPPTVPTAIDLPDYKLQPTPLAPYVTVHPPGSIIGTSKSLNDERAPLLFDIKRHRRIPIDWAEIIDIERTQADDRDPLRERIERTWLADNEKTAVIPEFVKADDRPYETRRIDIAAIAKMDTSSLKNAIDAVLGGGDVLAGRLVIVDRPGKGEDRRFFALVPTGRSELKAGISTWDEVKEAIEVFPKAVDARLENQTLSRIADVFDRTKREGPVSRPVLASLSGLSSDVPPWTVRNRVLTAWRKDFLRDLVKQNVVRVNRDDGVVPYSFWRMDKSRPDANSDALKSEPWWLTSHPDRSDGAREQLSFEKLVENSAWVMRAGERWYRIVWRESMTSAEIEKLDLLDWGQYEAAWRDQIADLEPLAWSDSTGAARPDKIPFSYIESVDVSPHLILEEFSRARTDYDIASASAKLAGKMLEALQTNVEATREQIRDTVDLAKELRSSLFATEWRIRRLKDRAQRLGYYLATGLTIDGKPDNTFDKPTAPGKWVKQAVEVGRLYVIEERTATYEVRRSSLKSGWEFRIPGALDALSLSAIPLLGGSIGGAVSSVGRLFGFRRRKRRVDRLVKVQVRYPALKEVQPSTEPWETLREQLQSSGFHCVIAELTDNGYTTTDGTPVREILRRCEYDEVYRSKLAIFLPQFQERLDEGLAKVRYIVAVRPEVGHEPMFFPSIFVEESISYRAEWRGTEIGELLHSISLAPGEERNVTISRNIERTAERVDSITSVLDVTRSEKLDLSSSIQATVSREKNSKSSSNWNASAQASFGPFGGSGGGGGSKEQSVRDFSETIKKSAMQATKEMRVNQRQEVKSSTTTTTKVSMAESTQSTFRNINQGTSLNVLFHQLNNVYDAGFFLDRLRMAYQPSVELVAGTGIHDLITTDLRNAPALCYGVRLDSAFGDGALTFDQGSLDRRILASVLATMHADYCESHRSGRVPSAEGSSGTSELVEQVLIQMPEQLRALARDVGVLFRDFGDDEKLLASWQKIGELHGTGVPFERHTLITPSTACYADCVVGCLPGTEPYSEAMRSAELKAKHASIERTLAEAVAIRLGKFQPQGPLPKAGSNEGKGE